jgi:hypothetical protein
MIVVVVCRIVLENDRFAYVWLLCNSLWVHSIYFVKVHIPETKGLTLEEIEQKFKNMEAERTATRAATSRTEADPLLDLEAERTAARTEAEPLSEVP